MSKGDSTFYVWACVEDLPEGYNTGIDFFESPGQESDDSSWYIF